MKTSPKTSPNPPLWAEKILIWFHPDNTLEEVQGDLEELFTVWHDEKGSIYAHFRYFLSVLTVLPPFVRQRKKHHQYTQHYLFEPAMINNYFKIATRSLQKNKLYSFINLTGLTLGLGVAITLFWIVRFEYSFDKFHTKADRIYRITSNDKFGESQSHVPQGVIKALKTQFPGVEKAANLYGSSPTSVKVGTAIFSQKNIFFAPPEILEILNFDWLEGDSTRALHAPGNVVIDDETAAKLFKGNAVGKTFRYNNETDLTVSGIIKKTPVNSEFPLQMIISWETLKQLQPQFKDEEYWGGGDSMDQGLVLLKAGNSPFLIDKSLTILAKRHKDESTIASYALQPLSEMHLDSSMKATSPNRYGERRMRVIPASMLPPRRRSSKR